MKTDSKVEKPRIARRWTASDIETLLLLNAEKKTPDHIAQHLGRTKPAVFQQIKKLGIKSQFTPSKKWTESEDETIRRLSGTHTYKQIAEILGRAATATNKRAQAIGVSKNKDDGLYWRKRPWSPSDLETLHNLTKNDCRPIDIAAKMGRSLSAIYVAQFNQGLTTPGQRPGRRGYNAPIGFETINSHGIRVRKVSNTRNQHVDWKRVDVIEWESIHGPVPKGHCLMVVNKFLPRTLDNLILLKRNEVWKTMHGLNLPPEVQELIRLKAQISRALNQQNKCS